MINIIIVCIFICFLLYTPCELLWYEYLDLSKNIFLDKIIKKFNLYNDYKLNFKEYNMISFELKDKAFIIGHSYSIINKYGNRMLFNVNGIIMKKHEVIPYIEQFIPKTTTEIRNEKLKILLK